MEWCNEQLRNWTSGHAHHCDVNTNGLEGTNKVIKVELMYRQLLSIMDFLQKGQEWVQEQSKSRSDGPDGAPNPNKLTFARSHTFVTNDWTSANAWKKNTSKQIRFLPLLNIYVAVAAGIRGDLTDVKTNVPGIRLTSTQQCSLMYAYCVVMKPVLKCKLYVQRKHACTHWE